MKRSRSERGSVLLASSLASAGLVACALASALYISANGIHLRKLPIMPEGGLAVHTLPRQLGDWEATGADVRPSKEAIDALGTENFLTRTYLLPAETPEWRRLRTEFPAREGQEKFPIAVSVHLAYYTGMVDTVPHVPERCFVGAGIQINGEAVNQPIPLDRSRLIEDTSVPEDVLSSMLPDGGAIYMARPSTRGAMVRYPPNLYELAMRVTPFYDGMQELDLIAGYFFLANGEIVPNANQVRLKAFELEDDYAYYLKVQFTMRGVRDAEELAAVAGSLLDSMFADLMRRTPDWVDVRAGTYPPDREGDG